MTFEITRTDIPALALGSSVLACGGGGHPYHAQLIASDVLVRTGPVQVIDTEEMDRDAVALLPVIIGAPLVMLERPLSLRALLAGHDAIERSLRHRIGGFVAGEVGGAQSLLPLVLAALTGKPLLDGDGMGRAFPEVQMCTFLIHGVSPGLPIALSDDHGLVTHVPPVPFGRMRFGGTNAFGSFIGIGLERILRRVCSRKGGVLYLTATIDRPSLARTMVRGSMRLALDIGHAVIAARNAQTDPVEAICHITGGNLLMQGKVTDVERRFRAGHDWGTLLIQGTGEDAARSAVIDLKNEYLLLRIDGEIAATVPDLVSIVETATATPISSDIARPGLRVSIVGIQSPTLLRSQEALRVVGPRAFGYETPFVPVRSRTRPS